MEKGVLISDNQIQYNITILEVRAIATKPVRSLSNYFSDLGEQNSQHMYVADCTICFWLKEIQGPQKLQEVDYNAWPNVGRGPSGIPNVTLNIIRLWENETVRDDEYWLTATKLMVGMQKNSITLIQDFVHKISRPGQWLLDFFESILSTTRVV